MQSKKQTELSQEEHAKIVDFLRQHPIGVLATVDADKSPHASAIYFSVDSDLHISFTTKRDTHKHANLERNNTVMLVAYDGATQAVVQAKGRAVEVTNPTAAQAVYHGTLRGANLTGVDTVPPIAKIPAGSYVAYTVDPEDIWISEYGWGDSFANAMKQAAEPPKGAETDDPA